MVFFIRLILILSAISFCCPEFIYSQKTYVNLDPDYQYKKGLEFLEKENYGVAQKYFNKAIDLYNSEVNDNKANAEFYAAFCAIELFNGDAEYLISQFISKYQESPKARMANFEMGCFRYRQQEYYDAIYWFEMDDRLMLPSEITAEFYFKLGYAYFMIEEFEKASRAFYEIKDVDT